MRGSQMGWAVREFYLRENWGFRNAPERRTFFHELMLQFDERWPVREDLYPYRPLTMALDDEEQQAVARRQDALRRVS